MDEKFSVKEYFNGKSIFITGGTGFLGKVLVEKLLRSCPDLDKIYLLIRPKKGKTAEERVKQITDTPLFELLKDKNSEALKKIVPISGNTTELSLGLSEEDRKLLVEKISVIFNVAASVRFDDFLKVAVLTNLRSAREIASLALEMKRIEVFVHVSTTYCNIDNRQIVEEILYPSQADWRDTILVAENCDEEVLNTFAQKFIDPFPNTYTFTKQLGEHCINDLLVGKIPTVLYRPSVVISSVQEPFQGWIDNFNGPVGLLIAGGAGILRIVYGDVSIDTDYIPVDNTVKAMIIASCQKALTRNKDLYVINGSKYKQVNVTLGEIVEMGKQLYWDVPVEKKIWFPANKMTNCWYEFYIKTLLFHMLPAFFLDILFRIVGHPAFLFKVQRKIYIANTAISYFMKNQWSFINDNFVKLNENIVDREYNEFNHMIVPTDTKAIYHYFMTSCNIARYYLLKEDKEIKPETFVKTKRMYYLHQACQVLFKVLFFWLIFIKFNILSVLIKAIYNYWDSL